MARFATRVLSMMMARSEGMVHTRMMAWLLRLRGTLTYHGSLVSTWCSLDVGLASPYWDSLATGSLDLDGALKL